MLCFIFPGGQVDGCIGFDTWDGEVVGDDAGARLELCELGD